MPRPAAIAVTGVGIVTAYGLGSDVLLDGLSACRSAISPLSIFSNPLAHQPVVGQVSVALDVEVPRGYRFSRTDRMAVLAARQVAGLLPQSDQDRRTCAVVVGTTVGGLSDLPPAVARTPRLYYRQGGLGPASTYPVSHVADAVAAALDVGGPRLGVSVACASGAMAIAIAAGMILDGRTRVALAGGSDALCPFTLAGFEALQALDGQPCRPFCRTRAGLNLGEGAGMLLLEDLSYAQERGATVLARLDGWAFTNDAFHSTAPADDGRGLSRCMELAMQMAAVRPDQIGYVNAHGTGTQLNDVAEAKAYERLFSGRSTPVPVSSTKSHLGHTLGAAGAVEAIITVLALRAGRLFPTLRMVEPIESQSVEFLRGETRQAPMEAAMSASAGFGGSNAALVFSQRDTSEGR